MTRLDPMRQLAYYCIGLVCLAVTTSCASLDPPQAPADRSVSRPATASIVSPEARPLKIAFSDIAEEAGLTHALIIGEPEKPWLISTNGTGAAVLDADGDGWMDLYVAHGADIEHWNNSLHPNRLYRNLGNGHFEESAERFGVDDRGWASAALSWDYDGDGDTDLYVTNLGPNRLYENLGDGHFEEVAAESGLVDEGWSMGAAAADYDHDGDLDLYVSHYLVFDPEDPFASTASIGDPFCEWKAAKNVACGPLGLEPEPDHFYRNNGDGTFTDISEEAGLWVAEEGYEMSVLWLDFDQDGNQDIYVAADATPNLLYRNLGDGTFEEVGAWTGTARNRQGVPQSGMGLAVGDADGDGSEEIYVTNFSEEENALYRSRGPGIFEEQGWKAGTMQSFANLGWGVSFLDVENDGDLDLMVANGHVYPQVDEFDPASSYRQRDQLFLNPGDGQLAQWQQIEGTYFDRETASRGLTRVDFDNDGDSDVLIVGLDSPPALLRNDTQGGGRWIGLGFAGPQAHLSEAGSLATASTATVSGLRSFRRGSSYMSSEDARQIIGLGEGGEIELEIEGLAGQKRRFRSVPADRYLVVQ